VRKFIKENKLEDYIVRLWWVKYKELWNYILSADVAVVPSLVEWFGFAAAETCAIEQQLICSNAAALTEVVSGKINFAEPWNPHAIAEAMIKFYNWKYQGINRKEFLWEDNINQTLDCYEKVLWK
jgi:glycosyltransferase involved in cell wall biosynthesis